MKKRLISLLAVLAMMVSLIPSAVVQAQMNINIGDYVRMGTYYGKPILWRCVDKDENGPLMLSDKILCIKAFDADGGNTSGSHGRGYGGGYWRAGNGSNYWADSNMRDWLNSESGSVAWSCGNPPDKDHLWSGHNTYDKEAGFLTNFTQSERNAMLTVTQKSLLDGYEHDSSNINENYHRYNNSINNVVQNYDTAYSESVTDKMFLLDVKQVNNVYNNLGDYYTAYPTQECVDNSEYKDSSLNTDNKWHYWLRSPGCNNYYSSCVRVVSAGGNVSNYHALHDDIGVRPAFYLNLTSSSTRGGAGTEYDPYTIDGGSGGAAAATATPTAEPTATPTAAPTATPYVFEVERYRADYILDKSSSNILSDMENRIFKLTCGKEIYENGKEKKVGVLTDFWRGMNDLFNAADDVSSLGDVAFEEKDIYEAVIWDIFESSINFQSMSKIDATISDNGKNVYDYVTKQMKDIYGITVSDKNMYQSLPKEQKEQWLNLVSDSFTQEYPGLSKSIDFSDKVDLFLDAAKDLEDVINRCSAYCALISMNDSMKQVLKEMYQKCPADETGMKMALLNCVSVMNSNEKNLTSEVMLTIAGTAGKRFAQVGVSKIWDGVKAEVAAAHPAVILYMVAFKSGTFISNSLFNTDATAEAYHKLEAVVKTEDVANQAYYKLKKKYQSDMTEANAANYNSAIDVMFNAKEVDCDAAIEYVESISDAAVSALFGVAKKAEEKKKSIIEVQNSTFDTHESILTGWIYSLENDNPIEYRNYEKMFTESEKRINKRYHIACPVDVYIYDKNGNEVGSVVNNKAAVDDDANIIVTSYNDEKIVYLDDEQYSLEYRATGSGTMDITIDEYNKNGKVERTVGYNDLSISSGTVYESENSNDCEVTLNGSKVDSDYDTAENPEQAVKKQVETDFDIKSENVPEISETETSFNSQVSSWAKEEVEEAYAEDIVPDVLVGEDLTKPVNRAEFAAIAVNLYENLSDDTAKAGENPFNDIESNSCKNDILKAYNLNITNGMTDNTFEPGSLITREQVATMLTRAYKKSEWQEWNLDNDSQYALNSMGVKKFSDDGDISDWAKESVYFMAKWDIINGMDDGTFAPKANSTLGESYGYATREQAVVIALRSAKHL